MAVIQFYRSSTAGNAKTKSQSSPGVVCFDTADGEIWLDGVLVGSSTGRILWVGSSDKVDSDLKVIKTDGTVDYISIHWDQESGKALSGEVRDLKSRVAALEESTISGITDGVGTSVENASNNNVRVNVKLAQQSSIKIDNNNNIDLLWENYS